MGLRAWCGAADDASIRRKPGGYAVSTDETIAGSPLRPQPLLCGCTDQVERAYPLFFRRLLPEPPLPRSPKARRRSAKKPERLTHHLIRLPGSTPPRGLQQAQAAAGSAVPLHVVRGHFKTFTAEAPLMGKHVGTYWWHPTVRGLREHGQVQTTYEVGPPREHLPTD